MNNNFFQGISLIMLLCIFSVSNGQNIIVPYTGSSEITTCQGWVLDNGGESNYANNSNGTLTIYPENPDSALSLYFTEFGVESCCDNLSIYNGNSTSAPLIGTYTSNPGVISSTAVDGSLTLRFYSDGSSVYNGFKALVTCGNEFVNLKPDLHCLVRNDDNTIYFGKSFNIMYSVNNSGNTMSNTNYTGFYLSKDKILDINDSNISQDYNYSIQPESYNNFSHSVTVANSSVAPGKYYLLLKADNNNSISEINEENNVTAFPVIVKYPIVDLSVQNTNEDTLFASNSTYIICDGIFSNNERDYISSFYIGYYLSTDTIFDIGDDLLDTKYIYSIDGYESRSVSTNIYTSNLNNGNYYLITVLDPNNNISETDETNNIKIQNLSVIDATVDYKLEDVYVRQSPILQGNSTYIYTNISNSGLTRSNYSYVGYYLSSDTLLDINDERIGTDNFSALDPGGFTSSSLYYSTSSLSVGTYYIIARADYQLLVSEVDEGNNIAITKLEVVNQIIEPAFTDVGTRNISYNAENLLPGDYLYMSGYIENLGESINTSTYYGIYLSSDSILDINDPIILNSSIYSISYGYKRSINSSVRIPENTANGKYYLFFKLDLNNNLAETDELNNIVRSEINIGQTSVSNDPDLYLKEISTSNSQFSTIYENTIDYKIVNTGDNISDLKVDFVLSEDEIQDINDTIFFTDTISVSSGENSYETNVSFNDTLSGLYYLIINIDSDSAIAELRENNNSIEKLVLLNDNIQDIKIDTVIVNEEIVALNYFDINYVVENSGGVNISSVGVSHYLSADSILNESTDYFISNYTVNNLIAGAKINRSTSSYINSSMSMGDYIIITKCDYLNNIDESDENNNIFYSPVNLTSPTYDIKIDSILTNETIIEPGDYVYLYAYYGNSGNSSISSTRSYIYLSTDTILDSNDEYLTSDYVSSFSSSRAESFSFYLPSTSVAGEYYIIIDADYNNSVTEENENNNEGFIQIEIKQKEIDLEVSNVYLSDTVLTQNTYAYYSYRVKNDGTSSSGSSYSGIYLSRDNVYDINDIFLGTDYNSSVTAGSYSSNSGSIYTSDYSGYYYLIVKGDYNNNITETNENNNHSYFKIYIAPPNIDLKLQNLSCNKTSALMYETVELNFVIENIGQETASNSYISFYYSSDSLYSIDDTVIGSSSIPSLFAGGIYSDNISVNVGYIPGQYYIIGIADNYQYVTEVNEDNNTKCIGISVYDSEETGDIFAELGINNNSYFYQGETINVSGGIKSMDYNILDSCTYRVYFSSNSIIDQNDALIYENKYLLDTLTTQGINFNFQLGYSFIPGEYYIIGIADEDYELIEKVESNNIIVRMIKVVERPISVTELASGMQIKVFPNPVKDYLKLEIPEEINQTELYIYNSTGVLVRLTEAYSNNETIYVADLPKGVYFIKLNSGKSIYTGRFVRK